MTSSVAERTEVGRQRGRGWGREREVDGECKWKRSVDVDQTGGEEGGVLYSRIRWCGPFCSITVA